MNICVPVAFLSFPFDDERSFGKIPRREIIWPQEYEHFDGLDIDEALLLSRGVQPIRNAIHRARVSLF